MDTQTDESTGWTRHDTATGYSERFSFEEAFADARRQLPPVEPPHPDFMEYVRVEEIGSESGGIAGFDHLYVKVARRLV
jgi:hypothetical protein